MVGGARIRRAVTAAAVIVGCGFVAVAPARGTDPDRQRCPRFVFDAGTCRARFDKSARRGVAPDQYRRHTRQALSCTNRAAWTFKLRYLFTQPKAPVARRSFKMLFSASEPVAVRLTARLGHLKVVATSPRLTSTVQFFVTFPKGLPKAGRWRLRFVADTAERRQCIDRIQRIRAPVVRPEFTG